MENFIVSARKYRPTSFESVIGQEHITTTLKNAIKTNHLAQAFLFCGSRGVGKTTCARILAKTINCENIQGNGEACNECNSCKTFSTNSSFNIHELDAASNNSVEDIRNLIEQVRYPPSGGKYKIYIIDEVHMLSSAAFNAFLKTLEEPPSYAIFILATTEKQKIIPTILSRCQIFDFNRIKWQDMSSHLQKISLKEQIQAEKEALDLIAIKSDGGLRDALSMFDLNVTFSTNNQLLYADVIKNLHILDSDYYFQFTDYFMNNDHASCLILFDEIIQKGFDGHYFIAGLMEHIRHLLYAKTPATVALLEMSEDQKGEYVNKSQPISKSFLLSSLNILAVTDSSYKSAKNPRLHVELALLKLSHLNAVYSIPTTVVEDGPGKKPDAPQGDEERNPLKKENKREKEEIAPIKKAVIAAETAPKPISKPVSTNLKSAKSLFAKKEKTLETQAEEIIKVDKPFEEKDLKAYWNQLAEEFNRRHEINKYVLMNREWNLSDNTIHIYLESDVQKNQFNESLRYEILDKIREHLGNYSIEISIEIFQPEDQQANQYYTQSEKEKFLLDKFPALKEFKSALGLDPEY